MSKGAPGAFKADVDVNGGVTELKADASEMPHTQKDATFSNNYQNNMLSIYWLDKSSSTAAHMFDLPPSDSRLIKTFNGHIFVVKKMTSDGESIISEELATIEAGKSRYTFGGSDSLEARPYSPRLHPLVKIIGYPITAM